MINTCLLTWRDKKGSGYQNPKTENHMERDTQKRPATQSKDQSIHGDWAQKVTRKRNKYLAPLLLSSDFLSGLHLGQTQLKARRQGRPLTWSILVCLPQTAGWRRLGSGTGGAKRRLQHTHEKHTQIRTGTKPEKKQEWLPIQEEPANGLPKTPRLKTA